MRIQFTSGEGYDVTVESGADVVDVRTVRKIGATFDAFDEDEGWVGDGLQVHDARVHDRYMTLVLGSDPLSVHEAEAILCCMRLSTAMDLMVYTASDPDDLAPTHTSIGIPYAVHDRLSGDDVVVYEGCVRHDSPTCGCDE